jgi:NADH-quinone oxidoreductase subunit J
MKFVHFFLCGLLFLSSVFVAVSSNPMNSVIFLILAFCNSTVILFFFNVDFLGLMFVIIYVGAVAVLFLFVVMMINIKQEQNTFTLFNGAFYKLFGPAVFGFFTFLLLLIFFLEVFGVDNVFFSLDSTFLTNIDFLYNIDILGQSLFNYFLVCFLIAGLILFLALLGSIVLTLRFNTLKTHQKSFRQLSRSDRFLSFF